MLNLVRCLFLVSTLFPAFCTASAGETAPESTPEEMKIFFTLGQTMAECGAFFRFMVELPIIKDNANTVELSNGKARGWEGAALVFLLAGSSEDAQVRSRETLEAIMQSKKIEHLSRLETMGENGLTLIQNEFDRVCMPLVPTQMRAIESMRSGN